MKKVIVLFLLLVFASPILAENVDINMDLPSDENIENQLGKTFELLEKAKKTNNLELYFEACEKGYNQKKKGSPQSIKIYNDLLSAYAIEYSLQRYQLTKDKKFFNRAYKWSQIAVNDRTSQIYSIRADILLASLFLEPKEMQKAYDLYRAVDIEGAKEYQAEYLETYQATMEYIKDKSDSRKSKWVNALKTSGLVLCRGLAAFGQGYSNYAQNRARNSTSTHCYTIGNHLYCDSY